MYPSLLGAEYHSTAVIPGLAGFTRIGQNNSSAEQAAAPDTGLLMPETPSKIGTLNLQINIQNPTPQKHRPAEDPAIRIGSPGLRPRAPSVSLSDGGKTDISAGTTGSATSKELYATHPWLKRLRSGFANLATGIKHSMKHSNSQALMHL